MSPAASDPPTLAGGLYADDSSLHPSPPLSASSDPLVDYINHILMDENSDDLDCPCSPLQQNFLHIFNGFHAILGSAAVVSTPSVSTVTPSTGAAIQTAASGNGHPITPYYSMMMNKWDAAAASSVDDDVPAESRLSIDPKVSTIFVLPRDRLAPAANPITVRTDDNGRRRFSASYGNDLVAIDGFPSEFDTQLVAAAVDGSDESVVAGDAQSMMRVGRWRANNRWRYPWEKEYEGGYNSTFSSSRARIRGGVSRREAGDDDNDDGISNDYLCFVNNVDLRAEQLSKLHSSDTGALPIDVLKGVSADAVPQTSRYVVEVDLMALLTKCARAVAEGKVKEANELLLEMEERGGVSAHAASGLQRAAFYFSEALRARLSGTAGSSIMYSTWMRPPSAAAMLRAYRRIDCGAWPFAKLSHFFANQHILDAAAEAPLLHIVDYGISYGFQWPCLISALARREGGPPRLRITGIEIPSGALGKSPTEAVERTGRRLAEYAKAYGVPFEFEGVAAAAWEDVRLPQRQRRGEVLAINCMFRLRHLMDELSTSGNSEFSTSNSVWKPSEAALCPRDAVLAAVRRLQPDIVVVGVVNAAHSSPFFLPRFREALYYYASCFDALGQSATAEAEEERRLLERERMGREIMNVVACEGTERVERPETYKKWQVRLERAGLRARAVAEATVAKSEAMLAALYHKEFSASQDDSRQWLLLGWKGRPVHALSAWS